MALVMEDIKYADGDTHLAGMLVLEESSERERPGILLIHGGAGLDDHARSQALRYASLGYVVFACDMYGEAVAGSRERVMAMLTTLRDEPALLARRARAGLDLLAARAETNGRFAAVGFCFGGMAVLTMARLGADLAAVVSMHGSLKTSHPARRGVVTSKVLVCHGALDPHVPMNDVLAFVEEMNRASVDYQVAIYGGAMHGFTHEHAVASTTAGMEYDAAADRRSFLAARNFLEENLA